MAATIMSGPMLLPKNLLMHDIYRMLLNTGRTYAAFERDRVEPLLERMRHRKVILDPMSGYGSLMTYCAQSKYDLLAFNVEYNPPSYFWQVLKHPANNSTISTAIPMLKAIVISLPDVSSLATISDSWFPEESKGILKELWCSVVKVFQEYLLPPEDSEPFALAILLPFVGRLASFVQGNVVTHVKPGGICVYKGWKDDFLTYLSVLHNFLKTEIQLVQRSDHHLILGDSRFLDLEHQFTAMITSPPYPNSRDYSSMFAPENAFIDMIVESGLAVTPVKRGRLIGSPKVSEKNGYKKCKISDIKSVVAKSFIDSFSSVKCSKSAKYDNDIYYIPYYCNYFCDLELAYENISKSFDDDFEGYLIVVNNTARKKVIPVAETIVETWQRLGFNSKIAEEFTRELSHVGGINPDVKGLSARHMEYTIKVWR